MEDQNKSRIDLRAITEAFRQDLQKLAGGSLPSGGALRGTAEAVQNTIGQAREVQQQAREQRREQVKKRTETLVKPLVERKTQLEERVEGKEREVPAPVRGDFVVAGRVMDVNTGRGLPGVRVRILDRDLIKDDFLGEVLTDDLGYYRHEYRYADFKGLFDRKPETYIQVLDEEGNALYISDRSFRHKASKIEVINATVAGSKVPESLERSKTGVRRAGAEIKELDRLKEVLNSRLALRTPPGSP